MDDTYHMGWNLYPCHDVLRDPSGRVIQPQPVSYATPPMPENDIRRSLLPHDNVQSPFMPDDYTQSLPILPGGAQMGIKARPRAPPMQPSKEKSHHYLLFGEKKEKRNEE